MFLLRSVEDNVSLELLPHEDDHFRARLRDGLLDAEVLLDSYQPHDLPAFFEGLAREWRGWAGERTWSSLEGDLSLTATADRAGHVSIRVALVGGPLQRWSAETVLMIEAGQLEAIAAEESAFAAIAIRAT